MEGERRQMKQLYIDKRFGADAQAMIATINDILADYAAQGYDLSLRQLYYQLVSRNIVENTENSYKNVGNLVSDARLAGLVDWDIIKDRGREMICNPHWLSPKEIIESCAQQFRVDRWENQPCYVEVMVEKQALEGVLIPVCREWDVPFTANKGYSSSSAMYDAGRRMYEKLRDEKEVTVLYLGDHDPSGIDMTRDVQERLRLFAECDPNDTLTVEIVRVALNIDQVKQLNPPENPAKLTDSRASAYIQRFGNSSWELDAIEPKHLAKLVSDAIEKIVDITLWEKSGKIQDAGRSYLRQMANSYKAGKNKKQSKKKV
jgi:hypothetical protein